MTTGIRKSGEFCWINMLTSQPDQAREFYRVLLGWTYTELPGIGHIVHVDGRDIGGLWDVNGPNTPKGTPACIGVMVKVDGADATAARVRSLGGTAEPSMDIMDAGRMVVCHDPNGAQFDLWEARKQPGTQVDSRVHGAPSWFETMTTDVEQATKFYTDLFGWTPEVMPVPDSSYTVFRLGDSPTAGLFPITAEMGKTMPIWATYFTVNDADESARNAVKLGARICMPMKEVAGVGRFCAITSPQGVMFYIITYSR